MSNQNLLKVKIRDMQNVVFEGHVDRVSSFNEVGRFDVLPLHANFISIIRKELALYRNNQKIQEFKIEQAVMKVKNDNINIFLGIEAFALDTESPAKPTAK
jgi:F0F1-type ATP synthase epsilon subunit